MTHKKSQPSESAIEAVDGALVKPDPLNVLALALFEIDLAARAKFDDLLRIHAWPSYQKYGSCSKEEEPQQFATMCTRMSNPDLFSAIAIVWKESKLVSDAELAVLGFQRSFGAGKILSRYSLGTLLWEEARCACEGGCDCIEPDQGKFKAQADRTIEAMLSFRLAEEDTKGRPREIRALLLLHTIMREYALFRVKQLKQRLPGLVSGLNSGEAA